MLEHRLITNFFSGLLNLPFISTKQPGCQGQGGRKISNNRCAISQFAGICRIWGKRK